MTIVGRDLFLNAAKSHYLLQKAIATFDEYVRTSPPPKSSAYYQARYFLREGKRLFDDTLKKARMLLGPAPPYSSPEVEEQRDQFLKENKIIVQGLNQSLLQEELTKDEFLNTIYSSEEIIAYLEGHFVSQSSGKRKLANIKMRMILDKLTALLTKGQELQDAAQKHFKSG